MASLTKSEPKQVGIGVIGTGIMGARHARNVATGIAGARLVAVADPNEAVVRQIGKQLGAHVYTNYKELLRRDDVDAVVIAAPSHTREEMVRDAVDAGKAIFSEKPAAPDAASARRLRAVLADKGVLYQMGFMRRFDPAYARVKQRIEEGAIGEPVLIRLSSRDATPAPTQFVHRAVGMFVDSSVHDFDLARWLMGDEVVQVYALGGNFVHPEFTAADDVDVAVATLHFARGGIGLHDNARHSGYGYHIRTEVLGTKGALQVGYVNADSVVLLKQGHQAQQYVVDFLERFEDAYRLEMEHFVECVRHRAEPAVSMEAGVRALEIAEAALVSLKTGQPVAVPEPGGRPGTNLAGMRQERGAGRESWNGTD